MMGRWRSGAPLALCPLHDDPELGADPRRNNDFLYQEDDPTGFKTPGGSHIRRTNPRDASVAGVARLHRMIRRGTAYGPPLPEGVLEDDGADRGLMFAFVGAHLGRQFEFVQSEWINERRLLRRGRRRRIPSSGRTTGPAASPSRAGRSAGVFRACRGSSSRGAASTASCPGCAPCAGSPISTREVGSAELEARMTSIPERSA